MKEMPINWKKYFQLILELSRKITFKPNIIICVNRGGLIIGRIISEILNKPLAVVSAKSYLNKKRCKLKIGSVSTVYPIKGNVLLIDDKVESGQTLEKIKDKINKIKGVREIRTACVFRNPKSKYMPDYYARKVDRWVVFPYENK